MDNIYLRLAAARKKLGFTQKQMAEGSSIALRTYCRYESGEGEREIPSSILIFIAQNDINTNWLLTGEGEMMRGKGEAEEVASEAVEALSENRMLEKIVLMLADMSEEVQGEVFAHVQKAKHLSDLERRVEELEAERAG